MAHTLIITVDDQTYAQLEADARTSDETPEGFASTRVRKYFEEPLLALAGSVDTGISNLAVHPDEYLAQTQDATPMLVR